MRVHIITMALMLAGSPALASSIEAIHSQPPGGESNSIVTKSCVDCPAVKVVEAKRDYIVPQLKAGTQTTEIRDIDGEKKIVRTEAWLGGSPVIFINKAPTDEKTAAVTTPVATPDDHAAAAMPAATGDGVDPAATTAAVEIKGAEEPAVADIVDDGRQATAQPLDTADFQLRVN